MQLGTVGFAAPEQYGGDRQSDARTDLYSLGAVLLYMGTGGRYPVWTSEAALALREHGCERLQPIVTQLLQARPEDRFASAEEVSEVLAALLRQPNVARTASPRGMAEGVGIFAHHGRPALIGVVGTSAGSGTTHTAVAFAHLLARSFKKVAVVELDPKSSAFLRLARLQDEETFVANESQGRRFRIGHVVYAKPTSRSDYITLLSEGFQCVVCDLGIGQSKELMEEFRRADLSVVVGAGAEWKAEELEGCVHALCRGGPVPATWKICVPFASNRGLRRIRHILRTKNVYGLPADPNPFDPGPPLSDVLQEVCGNVRVKSKRTSFRFLAKPKTQT